MIKNDVRKKSILSIGSFDGCHLGHQKLIQSVIERAEREGCIPTILTFYPHPRDFFQKHGVENNLFTPEMKSRYLTQLGIEKTYIQDFNQEFANQTANWFFYEFLEKQLNASTIFVGPNFCFGKNRQGDSNWLLKQERGPEVKILSPQVIQENMISSSKIRNALTSQNPALAHKYLGREYLLEGRLIPGQKLGRTLGIPTFNLGKIQQLIPANGVYTGWVWIAPQSDSEQHAPIHPGPKVPAVINIGKRPTLSQGHIQVEAHALSGDWGKEIYGHRAGFYLQNFLRDEQKFASLEELKQQIQIDIDRAYSLIATP